MVVMAAVMKGGEHEPQVYQICAGKGPVVR